MGEIDEAFVQALEHRPKVHSIIQAEGIPLIDLSVLHSPDDQGHSPDDQGAKSSIDGLVLEIGHACRKWGFFQVINHGVPLEKRQNIEDASRKFFAQPLEEKRKVRRDEKVVLGYYDTEHTKNVRDWKEVFDVSAQDPLVIPATPDPDDKEIAMMHNRWPEYPPEMREVFEEYGKEMEKLAYKLMELIALSLGLPAKTFNGFFKDQMSLIRLNHYPPCPSPHLALGLGRHKDTVALTILAQDDVGGLEVKRKSDGEWVPVKPIPDSYIVNVGDVVQVWSNDAYESVEHRVTVNSEKERFSIPFSFRPAHYTMVKPLDELTNERNPAKYRAFSWGKFFTSRRRSNFGKLKVENIQIHHFKVDELSNKPEGSLSPNK